MTTLDVLKAARELIRDPARWCQDAFACDADGDAVHTLDPQAVRWCAVGALNKVAPSSEVSADAYGLLEVAAGPICVSDINDAEGHEAVLAVYDEAIARLEREAPDA